MTEQSNKKYESYIKFLLVVYLAIQPLLEILLNLFSDKALSIGGVSIATLIRYTLLAVIVGATVIISFRRKITKVFIWYLIAVAVFIVLQWYNLKGFDLTVDGVSLEKNLVQTAFFVARYAIPVIVLYEVYTLRFTLSDLQNTVILVSFFVSASMIVSNLWGTDSISYSFGTVVKPAGSVLDWFGNQFEAGWKLFTSRGWFGSGNQLSSLLAVLLPVVLWISLIKKSVLCYVVTGLQLLAMLMLGTRVSVYSCFVLSFCVVAVWLLQLILNKEKFAAKQWIPLVALLCVFTLLFVQSPFYRRAQSGQAGFENADAPYIPPSASKPDANQKDPGFSSGNQTEEGTDPDKKPDSTGQDSLKEEVEHIASKYWIPLDIISQQYRFQEHREFWEHVVYDVEFSKRDNARDIKELILNDIFTNKGDFLDKLVGLGEVPIYPEKDFVSQYYYIGILGFLLFLVPFLVILGWTAVRCILQLCKKKLLSWQCVLLLSVVFIYGTSYFAGHALESLLVNTYIGLLCGMMAKFLPQTEDKRKEE